MTTASGHQQPRTSRRRPLLAAMPLAMATLVGLVGLPVRPASPTPRAGALHQEIVPLTGPGALATAPASTPSNTPAATPAATPGTASATAPADTATSRSSRRAPRPAPAKAVTGWTADVPVDPGTQSVGVSWSGAPQGAVSVRGRGADGWSEWNLLEADPNDGPDLTAIGSGRDAGGLAWFGADGVDAVELRVEKGPLRDLEVQPMQYDAPSAGSSGLGLDAVAGAATSAPAVLPRSLYTSAGWASTNSGCSSGPQEAPDGLKYSVIHHTVNSNTYAASDVPAMLAAIYGYHTGTQGWCDTAYNFIIDRFGRIWEGRSGGIAKAIVGGHAAGFNTGSVGVSFLGQFEPSASPAAATPAASAIDAAGRLLGWKLGAAGISPTSTVQVTSGGGPRFPVGTVVTLPRIVGHRDVGYTACPGANLYSKLATIRTIAASSLVPPTTTTTTTTVPNDPGDWVPFTTPESLVDQQYRDLLLRNPSSSERTYWSDRLRARAWSPAAFIAQVASTGEIDARRYSVIRLYRAYFLRNPDHNGLAYWLERHRTDLAISEISERFADSREFANRYGTLTNAAFIDLVYRNVLGRSPDAAGRSYWTGVLASGTSRGQVMGTFSQSNEFTTASREDVQVVGVHDAMLQTTIDADTFDYLANGLREGVTSLTRMAQYFYDRPAYATRF